MEHVMVTYGVATISSILCFFLCAWSTVSSVIKYRFGKDIDIKLNKTLISMASLLALIVLVLTIVMIASMPSILKSEFGALIQPISIALISVAIAILSESIGRSRQSKCN